MKKKLLLKRLDEIGISLEKQNDSLALIGLGSVGLELERLDDYSDLDFFAIVEDGKKKKYLEDLSWLSNINSIAYQFMNTSDGYKLLFEDGIFCEFAVFEERELTVIPFSEGRIVWKRPKVNDSISKPVYSHPQNTEHTTDWLIGEALTNLYVGLCRDKRGEHLSAMRFIQVYAIDRIIELNEKNKAGMDNFRDNFSAERRFEKRFPEISNFLNSWLQGYSGNGQSARQILEYLEANFEVNKSMSNAIKDLIM